MRAHLAAYCFAVDAPHVCLCCWLGAVPALLSLAVRGVGSPRNVATQRYCGGHRCYNDGVRLASVEDAWLLPPCN